MVEELLKSLFESFPAAENVDVRKPLSLRKRHDGCTSEHAFYRQAIKNDQKAMLCEPVDKHGNTLLHLAGHVEIVRLLLRYGGHEILSIR